MKTPPVALGMYTMFQAANKNFEKTIDAVKQMGYQGIEMYGEPSAFPAGRVKAALKNADLPLIGWHIEWKHLQPDTLEQSIAFFQEAELPCAVIPCLGGKWAVAHTPEQECEERWDRYLERIEEIRVRLSEAGIRLAYHNHEHEFMIRYGGVRLFDKLYRTMDPRVVIELDTGNAIEGGAEPAQVCAAYSPRKVFLHCKPYSLTDGFDVTIGDERDANRWVDTVQAAASACEWLVVESENTRLPEEENARACLRGLLNALKDGE